MGFVRQYGSFFIYSSFLYLLANIYHLNHDLHELKADTVRLRDKMHTIEKRLSTHQVQEIMKKEEKASKQIHALKKQVKLMHDELRASNSF